MTFVPSLMDGYRAFRAETFPANRGLYRQLVERGQSPRVMVIACCDSRVAPTTIFNARPGELFVVRNVANLIPPCEPYGDYDGTSAALEFAVTGLKVDHVVVLGHAFCGGVQEFLEGLYGSKAPTGFIAKWISLLRPAMAGMADAETPLDTAARLRALERASVVNSLANLETFPFVKDRLVDGGLAIHGAHFDIETGTIWRYDPAGKTYVPLDPD